MIVRNVKLIRDVCVVALVLVVGVNGYRWINGRLEENKILKQMVERLEADSRVAEVLVTGVYFDEETQKTKTTIKFLEYGSNQEPLEPKFYTFTGNIIQFQSLVIRFEDIHVRRASKFRGKSAYLFWKVFMLDGKNTQEFELTKVNSVPQGYKIEGGANAFETELWRAFWNYVLDPQAASHAGVKNAQIEAPGTIFVPGYIYTIKIEHDGGLRIDTTLLSPILKGETIPK